VSAYAEYVCSEQIRDALQKAPIPPSSTAQISVQCWMGGWGLFFWFQLQHLGSLSISAAPARFLLRRDFPAYADCCGRGRSAQHSVHGYGSLQPAKWTAAENRSRALRYSFSNWSVTVFQPAIDPSGQGIISPDVPASVERSPGGSKVLPQRGCQGTKSCSPAS
jgi:hypothetical protein